MKTESKDTRTYLTILADGKFHQTVPEGTEGAVVREYEDKDGLKQTKTELVHNSVSGMITGISIEEGEYGKSLKLTIDDDGAIMVNTTSNFGEDIMKKLPNVDFSKEVKLAPYAFKEGKKSTRGVTIYQDEQKIPSFYYDAEAKKVVNGMPEPEGDTAKFDSDDWKMYFTVVRKFLIAEVTKLAEKYFGSQEEVDVNSIE